MNDTIINDRQQRILFILKVNSRLSRADLALKLGKPMVSRITLIRDLNSLKKKKLIYSEGTARFTKYFLKNTNPLLEYVDIEKYFESDFDEREILKSFNSKVFLNLNNLFSYDDQRIWQKSYDQFNLRTKILDKSIYKRELERFVIEFAWKSSQIEGNTYDLLETETLITQNIEAKGHSKEEAIMLVNHKSAFDLVLSNKESFKDISFSDVLQLHNVLTKELISSGIRNQPVAISGTNYEPLKLSIDLEANLRKVVDLINNTSFPPEKALIALSMIAYLQPFKDGNKRTARTLANAILLSHGYFPLSYRNLDLNQYRKALIIFYEQNNLYHLKRLMIDEAKYSVSKYFRIK